MKNIARTIATTALLGIGVLTAGGVAHAAGPGSDWPVPPAASLNGTNTDWP